MPAPDGPLVGREPELSALQVAWERAAAGRPGVVLVSGEAGVGKSRLIAESAARAAATGTVVLTGSCVQSAEAHLPYLPFTHVLEALRVRRPGLVEDFPALGPLLPGSPQAAAAPGGLGQLPLFDAVQRALTEAAREPVLLVLEDLHWADRSSGDLLTFLLSRPLGRHLLVVASHRSELARSHPMRPLISRTARHPAVERIALRPLDPGAALALVRGLAAPGTAEDVLRAVAGRSEGNPFFAEELLSAAPDALPESLSDVLLARVERLDPVTQRVLRLASVAGGRWVRHDRLRAVAGLADDELDAAVREALAQHVLVPLDRDERGIEGYAFRHALLGEALYADLVPGERTRGHAAYAAAAEHDSGSGVAAESAHHRAGAGDQPGALVAHVAAARESSALGAPADVVWHAERALRLHRDLPVAERPAGFDALAVHDMAATAAARSGDPARATRHALEAVRLADAAVAAGPAPAGSVETSAGPMPADGADPAAAEIGAGAPDPDALVRAARARRALVATLLLTTSGFPEADRVAEEALALLDGVPGAPAATERAWAAATAARTAVNLGRFTLAENRARRAIELAGEVADGPAADAADTQEGGAAATDARITLSVVVDIAGDVEGAVRLLVDAAAAAAARREPEVALRAEFNRGLLHYRRGALAESAGALSDAVRRAERSGLLWSGYGVEAQVVLRIVRTAMGDWDGALDGVDVDATAAPGSATARLVASVLPVLAARGRDDDAARHLDLLVGSGSAAGPAAPVDDQEALLAGVAGGERELWCGNPAGAAQWAERTLAWLDALGSPWQVNRIRPIALGLSAAAGLAELARRDGDPAGVARIVARAEELHDRARAAASSVTRPLGPEAMAWLAWTVAELERVTGRVDAVAAWHAVVSAFDYGEIHPQAVARLRLGAAMLAAGDREAAAAELRLALDAGERLGAAPLVAAVRELAAQAGLRLAGEQPRASELLTPRERTVLALVAGGRTNRQAGQELFISEKTVSVHLTRVMAKLGAANRAEAVRLAYERGLLTTVLTPP